MVIILEKRKILEYLSKISLDLFVYFGVITLVVVASYFIQDDVGEGLASYPDSLFDWNYKPPWPPMNASYVNYTVLLGKSIFSELILGDFGVFFNNL